MAFSIKMKITTTAIRERQRAGVYIYKKQRKLRNVFIYKNSDTLQKARQFALRFIYKKLDTLCYAIFPKTFEIGIYIQKA